MKKTKKYIKTCFLLIVVVFVVTKVSCASSSQEDVFDMISNKTENKNIKTVSKYSIQQNTHTNVILNNKAVHYTNNPVHAKAENINTFAVSNSNYGENMFMKKERFEIFEKQSKAKVMKWLLMLSLALRGR